MYKRYRRYNNYRPYHRYKKYHNYKRYRSSSNRDNTGEFFLALLYLGSLIGNLIFAIFKLIFRGIVSLVKYMRRGKAPVYEIQVNKTPTISVVEPVTYVPAPKIQPQAEENADSRYSLKQSLITPAEKEFLNVLEQVVGDRYVIKPQVQLSSIVKPVDSNEHFTNYHDFNQIKAKSIDFVLFDKDYRPYLAIELDDSTHRRWDRIKRDVFIDDVMKGVHLRIIHVPVEYVYDPSELRDQIFQPSIPTEVGSEKL